MWSIGHVDAVACLEFLDISRVYGPGGLRGTGGLRQRCTGLTLSWQEAQSLPLLAVLGQHKGDCFERLRPEWTFFLFERELFLLEGQNSVCGAP